ncbi:SRPBCC domain-containing protein [Tropicimonas sp. IMCC34043]|uniref:SRPBCC domain-containing protein n=1 Tax=Tropicimonas sp. IMCC34043 TaxID=2248760 RepID=UPI000E24A1E6|nr:SRPBCC domain-containing protein [Tropicimonas sp. IMCC34043]
MIATIAPIRKKLKVPVSPERAFEIFTARLGKWWPLGSHSLSANEGKPALSAELEPRNGGKVFETRHDGSRADWATITVWDPGRTLAMDWYVGRDPAQATLVEIGFAPDGSGGTEVVLVHSRFERRGQGAAAEAARDRYEEGWDFVLEDGFSPACGGA